MCDDPAASNPFIWQLHRATLKDLVSRRGDLTAAAAVVAAAVAAAKRHLLCIGQPLVLAQSCRRRCADV